MSAFRLAVLRNVAACKPTESPTKPHGMFTPNRVAKAVSEALKWLHSQGYVRQGLVFGWVLTDRGREVLEGADEP
jgi:hypothetical protein